MDYSDGDRYNKARVRVKSTGKTGVEGEALTGAALLTIWKRGNQRKIMRTGSIP